MELAHPSWLRLLVYFCNQIMLGGLYFKAGVYLRQIW
jgi:hypothetical protein